MKQAWYEAFGNALGEDYLRYPWVRSTFPDCDYLERVLDVKPGDRLLDVGCGTGRHVIELARRGYRMTGIDISRGLLAVGERLACEAGIDVEFRQLDPVDNGSTVHLDTKLFEGEPDYPEDARGLTFTARELRLMCRLAGLECVGVYGGVAGSYTERPPQHGDWEIILLGRRP